MDFTSKYNSHKNTVFRIAYSYMGNVADAEDIMQNAFLVLLREDKEFPTPEDEKRWLIRVTINLCRNEKKTFWNRNRLPLEEAHDFCRTEADHAVRDAVGALNPKIRICIYLHYMEGYSVAEIAKMLKTSESAVKMRLKRGRQKLKLELDNTD